VKREPRVGDEMYVFQRLNGDTRLFGAAPPRPLLLAPRSFHNA